MIGGVQKVVLQVARQLIKRGYRCLVIPLREKTGDLISAFEAEGIALYPCLYYLPATHKIPSERVRKYLSQLSFLHRFRALLKSLNVDLVNSQSSFKVSAQAYVAVKQLGLPWVWTLQGEHKIVGAGTREISGVVELVNRTQNTRLTGVSQYTVSGLKAAFPIRAGKISVIPNCITLSTTELVRGGQSDLRETWSIPQDNIIFGAAGRLTPVKRFDLFIDAAAQLIRSGYKVHFTLAGSGECEAKLKQQVTEKGIGAYFHFVGFQKNIGDYFNMIDVFVMSSETEGTPLALLEACAVGRPTVATSVGGIPEILGTDGGILVEPNSVEALAAGLSQMLNEDVRKSYAHRLEQIAVQYSPEKIASEYEALYADLLAGL